MGLYDVVSECIVGGKHYTRPATGVEVDDADAAPLVESGQLAASETAEPASREPDSVDDAEPGDTSAGRRRGPRAQH